MSTGGIAAKQLHGFHLADAIRGAYAAHFGPMPAAYGGALGEARGLYLDFVGYNGVEIAFGAMLVAIVVYVGVSLATYRADFNMDRMLHRGAYATAPMEAAPAPGRRITWGRIIGYDENFTTGDKWITGTLFGLSMIFLHHWRGWRRSGISSRRGRTRCGRATTISRRSSWPSSSRC
ncbi:MAG: hypothetical protein WDO13_06760 [Verrucomicrobiota bacterium]